MPKTLTTETPTPLEAEILGEKVAAYVRIARALERMVDEAHAARQEALVASEADRRDRITRYRQAREKAVLQLWYLIVQREALGLRRHEGLELHYPIPEPLPDEPRR